MKAIAVRDLTKRYGEFTAVDKISFSVAPGQVFGFLGPNGVGKTTTIRILTGLSAASEGSCLVFGEEMNPRNRQIRSKIGVVFEEPNLYSRLSGEQNLQFFATLSGVKKQRVKDLLEEFQLHEAGTKPVAHYSKGMKQRLLICRALLAKPQLLILDEPTSGLDLATVELIRGHIKDFAKAGKTVFMSTHSLEEADELCHEVAFINHGKIIAKGEPASLKLKYGQDYLQVDLIPRILMPDFEQGLEELKPVKLEREGQVISVFLQLNQANLGGQIDHLRDMGRILRIHSQEASLREVFKSVLNLEE